MSKEVILTGIRANGELHLGNYLGAILPVVDLQRKYRDSHQINLFVADMHSFTTPVDFTRLAENIWNNLRTYAAAGLDLSAPETHIYRQSYIAAHGELAWYLSCFTYYGEAQRMTEFKDKAARVDSVTMGLFNYPVLMAADILLYGAQWVPVGEDQRQHLEICREIANRINGKFAQIFSEGLFVVPYETKKQIEFCDRDQAPRVRSLTNPDKKMSKSIDDPRGTILLHDDPSDAVKKVMGATTDSMNNVNFDWENQPGITNLLQMLSLLTGRPQADVNAEWQGKPGYGDLKKQVADAVSAFLNSFQDKFNTVDEALLAQKLQASEALMRQKANDTLLRMQTAVGLRQT